MSGSRRPGAVLVALAALTVALALISAYSSYRYLALARRCSELEAEAASLRSRLEALQERYSSLARSYRELAGKYSSLKSSYSSLAGEHRALKARYEKLEASYSQLDRSFRELLRVNERLEAKVKAYLEAGGIRTGRRGATALVQPDDPRIVMLAGAITHGYSGPADLYLDLWRMYRWVTANIRYARDPRSLVVTGLQYGVLGGHRVLYDFSYAEVRDYWRYAVETLREGRGDCEDQAILLASLVKAYFRHYVHRDYQCYVLAVHFAGDGGHALVVVPVRGRNIVILDPAGHYYTNTYGLIASRPVYSELARYQAAWRARIAGYDLLLDDRHYIRLDGSLASLIRALYGG